MQTKASEGEAHPDAKARQSHSQCRQNLENALVSRYAKGRLLSGYGNHTFALLGNPVCRVGIKVSSATSRDQA